MPVRLSCCALVAVTLMTPHGARADCAQEIAQLMSKDTEKLITRYNRIARQIQQKGESPRLIAEECRIARMLRPRLEDQVAALKQSACARDPQVRGMIADIVRGHEDDLAMARKSAARSDCQ
jgi:hypothetical protein